MVCHGDLVRHSLLKYCDEIETDWDEVGTKFDEHGTRFTEMSTKYSLEVI